MADLFAAPAGGTGEASPGAPAADAGAWVVDLDGVVWLAGEAVPGSAQAVALLRRGGTRVVFATNNSAPTTADLRRRLGAVGIDADPDDLVTSAQAAASMLEAGSTAVVCGEAGLHEALERRGVVVVDGPPADAAVVGWTRRFDFDTLARTAAAVRAGARLVGTNDDATYPTPDGLLPGAGSLLAAVATAGQRPAEVAGKPHAPMVALLRARVPSVTVVVGDRASTDGRLARALGTRFALVLSGVTSSGREPQVVEPDEQARDLASLVARHVST